MDLQKVLSRREVLAGMVATGGALAWVWGHQGQGGADEPARPDPARPPRRSLVALRYKMSPGSELLYRLQTRIEESDFIDGGSVSSNTTAENILVFGLRVVGAAGADAIVEGDVRGIRAETTIARKGLDGFAVPVPV